MWIFTKYGFFSIVCAYEGRRSNPLPNLVMIRARAKEHLLALQERFPALQTLEVLETRNTVTFPPKSAH